MSRSLWLGLIPLILISAPLAQAAEPDLPCGAHVDVAQGLVGWVDRLARAIASHDWCADPGEHGNRLPPDLAAELDRRMAAELRRQRIVGGSIGLIYDDRIVYTHGYGWELRPDARGRGGIPTSPDTMYRWASNSKPLTAVAALQLVERGQLALNRDVRLFVNEWPQQYPPGSTLQAFFSGMLPLVVDPPRPAKITTWDLLRHQSGIDHYPSDATDPQYRQESVVRHLSTFDHSDLVDAPGRHYHYSTHAYILLSAVVERAFAEQVKERIARPLGMTTLQPDYHWRRIRHRTPGYRLKNGRIVPSNDEDVSWKLGGGGFISTIDDFARWTEGLMQGKLMKPHTERWAWLEQHDNDGATGMGLGFAISGSGRGLKVSHGGKQDKTRTRMVFYPGQRIGAVVMLNSEHGDPSEVTTRVLFPILKKLEARRTWCAEQAARRQAAAAP